MSLPALTLTEAAREWGPLALIVLLGIATGFLFERFIIKLIQGVARSTKTELDDVIVRAVHPALVIAVTVAFIWAGATFLLGTLPPGAILWLQRLSLAIVVLLAAWVGARLVGGLLKYRARAEPRWRPVASLGSRTASVVIWITALLIILGYYGIEITPLLTSLGLAGLAVALALQDTLSNFFAGVWIQAGRAMRPGHFVRLESEQIEGYVEDIGWRTTQIRTLPGNLVIIPNAKLAQTVITDYHLPTPRMSLLISIGVGYESDPARVERILIEEALAASETTPGLLQDPPPFVRFIPGFGEYALQFTLICQVREFVDQYLAQHEIRKRVLARFRAEGIRFPYPVREIVRGASTPSDLAEGGGGRPVA